METNPGTGGDVWGQPEPQPQPQPRPEARPDWMTRALIGIVVVAVVMTLAVTLPALLANPPGEAPQQTAGTITPTPRVTVPPASGTTVPTTIRTMVPTTVRTPVQRTTPAVPETPAPAVTGTAPATQACVPGGDPGFTVQVSPVEVTAARGETVTYHMTIGAQNCFSEAVSMKLVASVLFFSQTYDLGTQEPPYPKSFEYPFTVPGSLVAGMTVKGVLTSTGGGITRENQLTLHVS